MGLVRLRVFRPRHSGGRVRTGKCRAVVKDQQVFGIGRFCGAAPIERAGDNGATVDDHDLAMSYASACDVVDGLSHCGHWQNQRSHDKRC